MDKLREMLYSILFTTVLFYGNVYAQQTFNCTYQYGTTELPFKISGEQLTLPFSEGMKKNGFTWRYEDKFVENYTYSSMTEDKYICPTLEIENYKSNITVFVNAKHKCNGICTQLVAKKIEGSKKTIKAISTEMYGSVGFYNSKKYFIPSFRILSDGTKEWSINNIYFIKTNEIADFELDGKKVKVKLDGNLINAIYKEKEMAKQFEIYRCVIETKGSYSYVLSKEKKYCPKNDLSTKDGQEKFSKTYESTQGAPDDEEEEEEDDDVYKPSGITKENIKEWMQDYDKDQDCNSIFGSVGDQGSVAWLINELLNYARIIGPMLVLVLSSLDFAKAIIQNDDDTMKKAQKKLIYRLMLAAVLFFIPSLVTLVLEIFGFTSGAACGIK